ncbi:MAG: hypothetical protein OIN84_12325, partial [Candidatus Methanoperedens sp.]|nr:hypothetical protein [Candidatus Methanoperedens sp.]
MNARARLEAVPLIVIAISGSPAISRDPPPAKKLIELGWDIPPTSHLRESWEEIDRSAPFDGLMFRVEAKDDEGRLLSSESAWDARLWKREWLQGALDDLRSCRFRRLTSNFVRLNATPGTLDWADDPGWAALAQKAGHLAWLMAAAGAKGIAVDFESYGAAQFALDPAKGRTFEETEVLARRRGRSLVDAIAREQPGAVVLALWLNSVNLRAGACDDRVAALAASHYGLLPAFIDGMLDALPPTMILVDGCENGYYMDSAEEYLRAAHEIRSWSGAAIRLVSRENRPRYRGQVQCGFGFYLDMFLNEEGNRYYFPPLDGSRLARLERNLGFARDAADEYVWVYGEQCRWWGPPRDLPRTVGKGRLWEEAMPGITAAIAYARDPGEAARRELAARRDAGTLANLVRNPSFEGGAGKPDALDGVGRWQDERVPAGVLDWDAGVG